ncbi:F-box domain [Macleaya cordata]|uniref:F-box domain n=1 Tax=Macleaya cordata TaxID=56857 RepID=A0A200QNT7_MACCD|nr:F-box domain [Macleaya cordata]
MENLLPVEITLDIFSRLTIESVFQCRQVCKTWRTLLRLPYFADMHLRRQLLQFDDNNHSKTGLIFYIWISKERNYNEQLCYGEYDENEEQFYKIRINHPLANGTSSMGHSSCNGLICFSLPKPYWFKDDVKSCSPFADVPICVCNPITREYVVLPRLFNTASIVSGTFPEEILCGFGYIPSTNTYKVVTINYQNDFDQPVDGVRCNKYVYTLGSGNGWETKKDPIQYLETKI